MQYRDILTLPVLAAATLTAARFVSPTGGLPTLAGNTLGVALSNIASGETGSVITLGTAPVEASAAISKGAAVEVLADGRIVTKDSGVTVGRALQAATAAGQIIEVLLVSN